ncbi:MAG TPA: NADP oxidoreductase, partial [Anaerolineaceae bacterium]|nr:NADP oxidoreductase [Anaerolineaceae bacterium]
MKTYRSMVLISNDPHSMLQGAQEIFDCVKEEVKKYQLEDEISIAMASDISRTDISPVVIVYPEAVA